MVSVTGIQSVSFWGVRGRPAGAPGTGLAPGSGAVGYGASGLQAPGLCPACLDRCERSLGLTGVGGGATVTALRFLV